MKTIRWTYFVALMRVSIAGALLVVVADHSAAQAPTLPMSDDNFLRMPLVGDHSLRLLSSNVVEVMMVTAKDPDPAPLTAWNFLDATGNGTLPAASSFTVSANGSAISVAAVGFKRRVLYAPLRVRDLRIANWLYLQLGSAIPAGAVVTVQNPGNGLWSSSVIFNATNMAQRYSPSIHVNQAGYISNQAKKAMVGQYLGTLGEMPIPSGAGFQLVNAASGTTAFTGSFTRRPDVGYSYSPTPYQQVFEADFTSFTTPGEYKLLVPGLGVSFPFYIDDGMAGTYARTYALGIYHQRCGTDNSIPYTRHTHGSCHTNLVLVPYAPSPEQNFVNYVLNGESAGAVNNPRHTAPRMTSVTACLYPYVNTNLFDARGGHHDAGDYSKYTTSVSLFIHNLIFAVDSLPGVKDLDNLGIPESGDGVSDIMQEAKWEADYLAKLQDADGGFYFIVYPRTRQYELDSLPDQADSQLVLPKNTAATAAAVGALADMASSPTFKATYPAAASNYLAKAVKGWQFLQNAIARYGSDGAYQMITFSGDVFMHDDELAWAAAALFAATGDPAYQSFLRTKMPNPNSPTLRRWDWWSMFGGYGCATRDYGFAVRSGKLTSAQVDPAYLALCEAEIKFAGSNAVDWSAKMAYGSSFTDESKGLRVAGWYFSGEWTLDPAAAWVVDTSATTKPLYLDCILKNYNYEMGCNPVNVSYLTGLGTKRQREIVHQYALNDRRVLPPAGIPLGNIQAQYDYLQLYKTELSAISYPLDDSPGQPYAYYDRWADTFNVSTEFVVSQTAKTLPAAAMLMAMSPVKTQAWNSATATILNLPASSVSTQPVTPSLTSAVDLSKARILWESGNNIARQEPFIGPAYNFTPGNAGVQWVEAEAQLPDGRRILAVTNFTAIMPVTNTIELYQPMPLAQNTNVVAWYKLDTSYTDATAHEPSLTPGGNAYLDTASFAWASRTNGAAVRVLDLGDKVTVAIPNADLKGANTTALSMEGMFYVNKQIAYGRGNANIFTLTKTWNAELALRHNIWTAGPAESGGATVIADNVVLANYLKAGQWQHFKVRLDGSGYTLSIDGQTVATVASTDLANWGGGGSAALEIGSFDGWIDEVVVKNEGGAVVVSNPPPASGAAVVSISATANAAEAGLVAGSFQISRGSSAATNLTVNFTVGGTATSGADYTALPASVTIPAGSAATTLSVTPLQDTIYEGNESVVVNLTANAAYAIGTGSATVTILDDDPDPRPLPPGQTNYIAATTALNTNLVALYHFDGNTADAAGRQPNLTLGGLSALDTTNLNWMSSPSGSALRVNDLGDNATVTLNNVNLYTPGVTASLGVEAFVFVKRFTAYSQKPGNLFKLARRWDAQLIYNQDTWQQSPELWGGVTKVIDVVTLAPYLQTNCWQKVGVFLDETGYFIKVNDVEVARTASTDIAKWAGAGNVDVEVGSFDGWVDELAVRSNVKGYVPPPTINSQTITFAALPAKTCGDPAFALSATASSGLAVSYNSGNPSVATISGNTVTIVGAGSAVLTASQAGNSNYAAATPVTQTLTVNQAAATISLGGLAATYDSTAKNVTATTTPSGLPVTITYNGSSSVPSAAGNYAVVATVNSANYSGSASGTLAIAAATQTIAFGALANKTYGDAPYTLSATASSGLPVTFSSGNTAVATVSGNMLTIVGAGSVFITASQGGNSNSAAAVSVTQTLIVNKATATVSLSGLSATYDGTAKSVSATTTPGGLPVTITYSGSSSAPSAVGNYAVVATVNSANYSGSASGTLAITAASQTISFAALTTKTYGDPAFTLSATASSGLPVSYSSGNPSVATISGNTVTIVGAGSAVITAAQAGSGNYAAATSVPQTLTVNQAAATISLGGLSTTYDGTAKSVSATTTPGGLPVTITYNGSSTAPSAVGGYAVVATVSSANYSGSASGTLTIAAASQTISFTALPPKTYGDTAFALSAAASSGLPVSYSSGNPSVATVSGNTLTIVGAGSAVITAAQAGNGNYQAATSVTQPLLVNPAVASISLAGLNAVADGTPKSVTATTTPAGLPVTITYNGSSSAPSAAGSYAVVATINSPNYSGSTSDTLVLTQVGPAMQLTVLVEGQGNVTPDLSGQNLLPGTNVALSAFPSAGWKLDSWLLNGTLFSTNLTVDLTMNASLTVTARFVDAAAPSVAITGLSTNAARGTMPSLTLAGTAADNDGVAAVEYAVVSGGVSSDFQTANGTTNWTVDLPSPNYGTNIIRVRARDLQGNLSPEVTQIFNYVVLSPFSLTILGNGSVTPNLNGQQLELGRTYALTATAGSGFAFDRWDGGVLSSNNAVSFVMSDGMSLTAYFRDTNAPLVAISSPGSGAKFTNSIASFNGTASDAFGVARVEYSLNGGSFQPASGTTNWSAVPTLAAGTNVFRVRSLDLAGNMSSVVSRSVFYSVTSPLTLLRAGQGTVAGATNGQRLEIGRAYKVTATPATGQMFLAWSGGIASDSSALTFLMQPNLTLQANFVTNPFTALKGAYQALFYESNITQHARSGLLKLTVGSAGSYSASLKIGAKTLSLAGSFNARGQSRLNATIAAGNVVGFDLALDVANLSENFTGIVTGAGWAADLSGYRTPVYAAGSAPVATGAFTFVIPADDSATNNPAGLGFGTLTISSTGVGTLGGKLGDGTAFSVSAPLSRNGFFPLYAQLYSSLGSTLSWLHFTNQALSDFDGALSWIKPPTAATNAYPAGFAVESFCVGSAYNAAKTPLLSLTNAPMAFSGGALGADFQNLVTLQPGGTMLNLSSNKLSFTLTKASGLFSGSVINPGTGASLSYSGVLFQKWNAALGYAVLGNQTSALKLATP